MAEPSGIASALARIPSGLFVLTAGRGADATGMLVSWVMQAGFEPPALTVALKKGRHIGELIRRDGAFCVSVLDDDSKALMKHFARGFAPGVPAFEGLTTRLSADGVPMPDGAHAHLECRLIAAVDAGDHELMHGEVTGGRGRIDIAPLVHVRKNGLSY